MRLPKFRYAVLWGAALGLAIPLIVMSLFWLRVLHSAGAWLLYIWPTSIMLMATETLGYSLQAFAILACSIAWNVLLYVMVLSSLWSIGWVLRAWRASLRDGTTI
jgi:hypothetical protein